MNRRERELERREQIAAIPALGEDVLAAARRSLALKRRAARAVRLEASKHPDLGPAVRGAQMRLQKELPRAFYAIGRLHLQELGLDPATRHVAEHGLARMIVALPVERIAAALVSDTYRKLFARAKKGSTSS